MRPTTGRAVGVSVLIVLSISALVTSGGSGAVTPAHGVPAAMVRALSGAAANDHPGHHGPGAANSDTNGLRWTMVNNTTSTHAPTGAALAADPEVSGLIRFGGSNGVSVNNETWEYRGGVWSELCGGTTLPYCASSPPARMDAALAYDSADQELILFGGYNDFQYPYTEFSDTWAFHDGVWSQITQHRAGPGPTYSPEMVDDPPAGHLVLYTGYTTWTFSNGTWSEPQAQVNPNGAYFGEMVFDPAIGQVVMISDGGATFEFNGQQWTYVTSADGGDLGALLGAVDDPLEAGPMLLSENYYDQSIDAWTFTNGTWTNISSTILPPSSPTVNYALEYESAYDPSDGYTVLYATEYYASPSTVTTWILTDPVQAAARFSSPATDVGLNVSVGWTLSGGDPPYAVAFPGGLPSGCSVPTFSPAQVSVTCDFPTAGSPSLNTSVTDGVGNRAVFAATEPVNPRLISTGGAGVAATTLGIPVRFDGSASAGTPPYEGVWTFGDGASSASAAPLHNYTGSGTFVAIWTVTDAAGAVQRDRSTVIVNPLLGVSASIPRQVADVGMGFNFSTTLSGGTYPDRVNWSFGDGTYSVEPNVTHAYAEPGEYVASVQVRDLAGAVSSSKVWLQVNPLLNGTASASTHSTSVDSDVGFVGTVAGGTAPYTFWWQFGDEDWGTGPAASHQYLYAGVFPASVTINDSAGASQFIPMTVTVVPGTNQSAPSTNPPPGGPGSSPPGNTPAPPGRNGTVGLPTDIQHVGSNVASLPLGDAVLYAGIAAVLGFAAASAWSRRRQPPVRRAPRAGLRSMGTRARQPRPHSRPDTPGGSRGSTDPN